MPQIALELWLLSMLSAVQPTNSKLRTAFDPADATVPLAQKGIITICGIIESAKNATYAWICTEALGRQNSNLELGHGLTLK